MVRLKRNETRCLKHEDSTDNIVRNNNNSIKEEDDDINTSNYEEIEVVFSPRLLSLLNEADKMFE